LSFSLVGIKPRDDLARDCGTIEIGERGGILVNEQLKTSVDGVYAIGEIALYNNFIYGLIAPGTKYPRTTEIP
jgi:nitrite reductase (NADH) large subunit